MTASGPATEPRSVSEPTFYTPAPASRFPAFRESANPAGQPRGGSPFRVSSLRALRSGLTAAIEDAELLKLLLGPGRSGDPDLLARKILEAGVLTDPSLPVPDSEWWNRLGPARAARLFALLELLRRSGGNGARLEPALRSPCEVYEATADLRPQRREHFVGLYLNSRNRLLARETVSVGSLNASIVHPREVYEPALRHGAASLVVVHNHPSGETDPSEDDLNITRRLSEAGEILGISLLDHVIVGRRGYTSLKELGHL